MKTHRPPFPALALLFCAAFAPLAAQVTVPLDTASGTAGPALAQSSALSRPDPAANASAALNNGGNPAAAIGAAIAAQRGWTNRAPLIAGNAGTVGVNGDTGSAAAATSANGVDTVGTISAESIGMRRARLAARNAVTVAVDSDSSAQSSERSSLPAAAVTATLSSDPLASSLRSAAYDRRGELTAHVERQLEAKEQALDTAKERADELDPGAKASFKSAAREVRTAERRLQKSLRNAERAAAEKWLAARDALAADYEIYALAVASAEHAAGVRPGAALSE